jgi:hypothetical protein
VGGTTTPDAGRSARSGGSVPPAVYRRIQRQYERDLRKQERQRGTGRVDAAQTASGQLPHTGLNVGERALVGFLVLLLGAGLRRAGRRA